MPHLCLVPLTGLRIREEEMFSLGMSLPGLGKRAAALAELPALGLLTLAGMTPENWTQSYHDAAVVDDQLIEDIVSNQPTLIAISALTASVNEAYRLADTLRAEGLQVAIGGLHVTVCSEEAQQHADAVVVGEGEPVWLDLLDDAEVGNLKPIYQAKGAFNLAESPLPRFDLLGERTRPRFTMQTERGCPLACDFCAASRILGSFREKPLANLRIELAAITAIDNQPWLELADDNTFAGRRDAGALLELLADSGARYFTEADWRIGERPDLLNQLAASGCVQVLVGIESLAFQYPGMGAKRALLDRIMASVQAIQEAGVVVNGCFIVGADGETNESIDRLTEFILASPLAEVQLTLQTPFPGAPMFDRFKREARLLPKRDWSFYTLFDVTYQPDSMSVQELERGFHRVVKAVFSRSAATRRDRIRKDVWRTQ